MINYYPISKNRLKRSAASGTVLCPLRLLNYNFRLCRHLFPFAHELINHFMYLHWAHIWNVLCFFFRDNAFAKIFSYFRPDEFSMTKSVNMHVSWKSRCSFKMHIIAECNLGCAWELPYSGGIKFLRTRKLFSSVKRICS